MEIPEEYVDFAVKYKEWAAIKRMRILPNTKPEEIAFHLAGIRGTIDGRAYGLLGISTEALDNFAESTTSNLRKGMVSISEALGKLDTPEAKKAIDDACTNKAVVPLAKTYLLNRLVVSMNVQTGLTQEAMSKLLPDLKMSKFLGRAKVRNRQYNLK